eukprot:GGOE01029506.1.p1 GENE.GGOE01029506.1~~GGOE01029506.1.p1  ORF type:complete len:206 (-),score=32.48 GGOE01029506.1:654-1241(-)
MANMSFTSMGSSSSNDVPPATGELEAHGRQFPWDGAVKRTALVHSPYTFTGPYEVVLPPREEEEGSAGNGGHRGSCSPKGRVCTSPMCNAAFAFHVSSCPLARARLAPLQIPPSEPESPTVFSPASSVGTRSPEPQSPLFSPAEPSGSPTPMFRPPFPATRLNHHHRMLRALRQVSHQQVLQQGKGLTMLEGRSV